MTFDLDHVPLVGRHTWLRDNCQYQNVLLLRIETNRAAYVPEAERVTVQDRGDGLYTAAAGFGFMESPNVGEVLPAALPFPWEDTVFVLARPITAGRCSWIGGIVLAVYQFLRQTGQTPIERFQIPAAQSISVGLDLEI
jgi:KUP system potassium uptake protein